MTQVPDGDIREYRSVHPVQLAEHRPEGWHILRARGRLDAENLVLGMGITRQGQVSANRMIVIAMVDGTDNGIVIRHRGKARQMLRDRDSGDARGSGFELAPDLLGCIGFQIQNVQVRRPAIIEDQDAALTFPELPRYRLSL